MWQIMYLKVRWAFFLFFLPQMLKRRTSAFTYFLFNSVLTNGLSDLKNSIKT